MVVVMVENRSFDHIFGLKAGVDGNNGKNFTNKANGKTIGKNVFAFFVCLFCFFVFFLMFTLVQKGVNYDVPTRVPCDPCHGLPCTSEKIFGVEAYKKKDFSNATMAGFAETEFLRGNGEKNDFCEALSTYKPEKLPVLNFLGKARASEKMLSLSILMCE